MRRSGVTVIGALVLDDDTIAERARVVCSAADASVYERGTDPLATIGFDCARGMSAVTVRRFGSPATVRLECAVDDAVGEAALRADQLLVALAATLEDASAGIVEDDAGARYAPGELAMLAARGLGRDASPSFLAAAARDSEIALDTLRDDVPPRGAVAAAARILPVGGPRVPVLTWIDALDPAAQAAMIGDGLALRDTALLREHGLSSGSLSDPPPALPAARIDTRRRSEWDWFCGARVERGQILEALEEIALAEITAYARREETIEIDLVTPASDDHGEHAPCIATFAIGGAWLRIYAIASEFAARTGILSVRADAAALVGPALTVLAAEYIVEDDAPDSAERDMERLSVAVAARLTAQFGGVVTDTTGLLAGADALGRLAALQLTREDAWPDFVGLQP